MNVSFSGLSRELNKFADRSMKNIRLASYNTLKVLAFESRKKIINDYPRQFPDEDGIKKNRGVPKLVVYDKQIDKSVKNEPSIRIYASDKIDFMEKQEFGGTISGGKKGSTAATPFKSSLKMMRSGSKGMKEKYQISRVISEAKSARLKGGKSSPKPFFMETKSGHTMIAVRKGKGRTPITPLYHFDRVRTFRKRWDFFKTVDGVVVSMTDKVWGEQLRKALDRK